MSNHPEAAGIDPGRDCAGQVWLEIKRAAIAGRPPTAVRSGSEPILRNLSASCQKLAVIMRVWRNEHTHRTVNPGSCQGIVGANPHRPQTNCIGILLGLQLGRWLTQ